MLSDLLLVAGNNNDTHTDSSAGASRIGLRGVRVLELGCGAGLCSLVAAMVGADVLATDGVADATRLVAQSAQRNRLGSVPGRLDVPGAFQISVEAAAFEKDTNTIQARGSIEVGVIDWFNLNSSPCKPSPSSIPLLIGSDVLFFRGTVCIVALALSLYRVVPHMFVLLRRLHRCLGPSLISWLEAELLSSQTLAVATWILCALRLRATVCM